MVTWRYSGMNVLASVSTIGPFAVSVRYDHVDTSELPCDVSPELLHSPRVSYVVFTTHRFGDWVFEFFDDRVSGVSFELSVVFFGWPGIDISYGNIGSFGC